MTHLISAAVESHDEHRPSISITPVHVADLLAEGELMPVYSTSSTIPMGACWSTPA